MYGIERAQQFPPFSERLLLQQVQQQKCTVGGFFIFIFVALLAPNSGMDKLKWCLLNPSERFDCNLDYSIFLEQA